MPKLPKNYAAFQDEDGKQKPGYAGRVDFENVYPAPQKGKALSKLPGNIVSDATSVEQAAEQDIIGKKLFLNALSEVIAQEGGTINAADAFRDVVHFTTSSTNAYHGTNMDGSQVLMSLHRFNAPPMWNDSGPPETTTRYGFQFRAPQLRAFETEGGVQGLSTAYYQIDVRPFELLEKLGVPAELKQRYLNGFMKMAEMAEHDYIHQLTTHPKIHAKWHFSDEMNRYTYDDIGPRIPQQEQLALGAHAQVCDRLFAEHLQETITRDGTKVKEPKPNLSDAQQRTLMVGQRRKQKVLDWAEDTFQAIEAMQKTAAANATPEQEKAWKEAITYLAEIYAHRLFRVVSPEDMDLQHSEVAPLCDRLTFAMPPKRGKAQEDQHGIEGLRALCGTHMGDLYVQCHAMEKVKVVTSVRYMNNYLTEAASQMMTPMQFIDGVVQQGLPRIVAEWEKNTGKSYAAYKAKQKAQAARAELSAIER